ncbi:hypothetical protein HPB48_003369 [Haemaphysalis longicornis]|uniref:Uncharacterized protein n=1 Tax=Haemaphysalis longicornis TaxID=44386 RepID=A0A9J6GCY4_HAELO|nr:hypothetical protein HPB48_003369 [Haemaphysalis longicornis]
MRSSGIPRAAASLLFPTLSASGGRSSKTFMLKNNIPDGTHEYYMMKQVAATLGSGNLRLAVVLGEDEDLNEWAAVNMVDFFNQINMLYGTESELCTESSCAVMSAGASTSTTGLTDRRPRCP